MIRALLAAVLLLVTACANTDTATDDAPTREITHAAGVAKVKENPSRVVVLDTGELETVAALGVKPVGMTRADVSTDVPDYLKETVQGVEVVGTIQEPNLEKIASLNPDLILGSKVRVADKYAKLAEIAPTVLTETVGVAWKENFLLLADALNKKSDADKALAEYETKAKQLGEKLGDPAATRVSMVRFMPQGKGIRLYAVGSFIGTILADVGFSRPESQLDETKTFIDAGPEELSKADGDVIFYASYGPPTGTPQDQITGSELWRSLTAVKNGRATEVSDELWYLGTGINAAYHVLAELEKLVRLPGN